MTSQAADRASVIPSLTPMQRRALSPEALELVGRLHREFNPMRESLLARRRDRWQRIQSGESLDFLTETAATRAADWRVAATPADLEDRRVEITGPVDRKMMINALNSGAQVFMADFEDALSPTWRNVIDGQNNLLDAARHELELTTPDGKRYAVDDGAATLIVRPRGWHLTEKHVLVDGAPVSASIFDFGVHFFNNARALLDAGSGPYFYLPKLEGHLEARLWNDVFNAAQDAMDIPRGTIRATVLIETIFAAFEMDEILYELRDHAAGLNAGRWDYLFSIIKAFRADPRCVLPDRAQLTMSVPFMRAYTQLLVRTCHRRGAHAIGGMAAFIPNRREPDVTTRALEKVREDKRRESADGFDGSWVAHPDLVPVARAVFDSVLGSRPNQKGRTRDDVFVTASDLLNLKVADGRVTLAGIETNVDVALQYLEAWLRGQGAVAIHNLMEDTATAEISRSQLWQWIRNDTAISDDGTMSANGFRDMRAEVLRRLSAGAMAGARWDEAAAMLDSLVLGEFHDFLTDVGYRLLDGDDD
jgi:malate synthase